MNQSEASLAAGRAAGYCWLTFGARQLHCCREPYHPGGHWTPYGGPTEFRSRLAERRPSR
ncbi:hypothetical protein [Streptomyces sp. NPDC017230]|uniref:hypothetical protein n=1 Tax=unclassified Streptomyces TaxID=2593676 RepID=UPI0037B7F8B2